MEPFPLYLIKSVIWLSGFALVYFLFLKNERFFRLKRFYLIAGILVSFLFPLLTFHYRIEAPAPFPAQGNFITQNPDQLNEFQNSASESSFNFIYILALLYLAGVLFFAFMMAKNIILLLRVISTCDKSRSGKVRVIRSSCFRDSFSFFNYIFISSSLNETESEMIMNHELAHINQKHWLDLLLVEFIRLFQWINPFAWLYTDFIRQNHEYIADEVALQKTSDPAVYRAVLLNQLFNTRIVSLSNSFNFSLNKKRFEMMKKAYYSPYRKMKILSVLPVIALVFYAFAKPEYNSVQTEGPQLSDTQLQVTDQKRDGGLVVGEEENTAPNRNLYVKLAKDQEDQRALKIKISDGSPEKALTIVDGVVGENGTKNGTEQIPQLRRMAPEDFPTFGGRSHLQFNDWVTEQVRYPAEATSNGAEGYVTINFTVGSDGTITNIRPSGTADPILAGEIIRVLKSSPQWEPPKNPDIKDPFNMSVTVGFQSPDQIIGQPPFVVVEEMPMYPGGEGELLKFIAENTRYPEEAKARQIEGKVIIRFVVNTDGNAKGVSVLKGVDPMLDAEATRVVSLLQGFKPGMQGGRAVPVWYMVPINFSLPKADQKQ